MNFRIKISKKQLLRLIIFASLLGFAFILGSYFEKSSIDIVDKSAQKSHEAEVPGIVCFFAQNATTFSAKISMQKTSDRKFFQQSHAKFIQKYHQLRNYQLLKCEAENFKEPLILTLHFLGFRNCFYSLSDDVPLIS